MAIVDIIELIKPETGEKFYPYAHLNGVKGAEQLPRIGGSVETTLPTPIFQVKDALNAQFYPQTHAQAVIGLAQMIEDNQFFEKESDGNGGFRIKLKDGFTGLYADGWVASGGVGSGGSSGGGLIDSVLGVADLNTPIATEVLTETFSSKAIQAIWDAVKVLQNTTPNVSLVNGANNSTLTVNGTTADFYTKLQIDAIVGAVYRPAGNASSVSELGTLTATNIGKVYNMTATFTTTADFLEGAGKSFPAGTNVVIVDAGSGTYKYDVLSGFVDLSGYAQKVVGATAGNFAGLDANGNLTDSGHKHGDYVTALGTSGNYLTWTKNGTTNNIAFPTLSKGGNSGSGNAVTDITVSGHQISLTKGATFITNADVLQTTNPFRPGHTIYISKIDNALYAANKRFTVTGELISGETTTAVTSDQLAGLFNGDYDGGYLLRDGKTLKIHIKFDGWPNSYFPGYPYGYFFMSFYYVCKPQSVSARCYCNYEAQGIGWHDMAVSNLSSSTSANLYRFYNAYYNISEFEFTIVGDTTNSNGYTYITQLELQLTRPAPSRNPFVSKYVAEELYYPLTIKAGLTVTGKTSLASDLTLSGSTNTARRIYFGDTSHYLELDEHGFHFSHGVYSDGYVAAGGIGAGGGSGTATELGDLVDVSLANRNNGDLLVYNSATSHWENKPQSSIIPSVSIGFNDLTSHPTTLAGYGITDAYTKTQVDTLLSQVEPDPNVFATRTWVLSQNFLQPADLVGYVTFDSLETELADYVPNSRKVNNHALTSDIVLAKGDVGLGNVENTALSTWAGSQNITTVGTIASGTWRGTPIANDKIANAFVSIAGNNVTLGSSLSATDLRNSLGIPTVESNIATIMSWFSEDANGNIVVNPKNNTPRGFYNSGWISTGGVGSGGGSGSGNAAWGTVTDTGVNLTVDGITRLLARGDKNKMVTLSEDDYANLATKDADTYYFTYEE